MPRSLRTVAYGGTNHERDDKVTMSDPVYTCSSRLGAARNSEATPDGPASKSTTKARAFMVGGIIIGITRAEGRSTRLNVQGQGCGV